jgi:hypothetical protein
MSFRSFNSVVSTAEIICTLYNKEDLEVFQLLLAKSYARIALPHCLS